MPSVLHKAWIAFTESAILGWNEWMNVHALQESNVIRLQLLSNGSMTSQPWLWKECNGLPCLHYMVSDFELKFYFPQIKIVLSSFIILCNLETLNYIWAATLVPSSGNKITFILAVHHSEVTSATTKRNATEVITFEWTANSVKYNIILQRLKNIGNPFRVAVCVTSWCTSDSLVSASSYMNSIDTTAMFPSLSTCKMHIQSKYQSHSFSKIPSLKLYTVKPAMSGTGWSKKRYYLETDWLWICQLKERNIGVLLVFLDYIYSMLCK